MVIEETMRILEIIHGYPPLYNAGSENYTEAISNELSRCRNEVLVFCREENQFTPEHDLTETVAMSNSRIRLYIMNMARTKDRFLDDKLEEVFERIVSSFKPEIAHIEHLNHLSLGIPSILRKYKIPIVYTIHDFWLMCPRGQFIQTNITGNPWKSCEGQDDMKCASICYSKYHSGSVHDTKDLDYWTSWVSTRMSAIRNAVKEIDWFIAPSRTVLNSFVQYFPDAKEKVTYLDYGFDLEKLKGRKRAREAANFVFGYVGTHIPAKGIDYLLKAFGQLRGNPTLRIWGRERSEYSPALKNLSKEIALTSSNRIEWMGEFDGDRIVKQVFDRVDALVVPSIWLENSPLVIHEAQQARVPVITANIGGMAEYVKHEINGILFEFRNVDSLRGAMQTMLESPKRAIALGERGYLYSKNGDVVSIESHVESLANIFQSLISRYDVKID